MQAKISIGQFRRTRHIRYSSLFVGNDVKGEVRAEWSSLFQSLHRNKFKISLNVAQVQSGGIDIDTATNDYLGMFDRMEEWCDANCQGFWSIWDNEDELDENALEVEIEAHIMFEHEEDLMLYIKDCALMMKLSY